jgi:hypothetical protein
MQNKIIRFWGIPNKNTLSEKFWNVLVSANVDLIGNDCPECFKKHFKK